MFESGSCEYLAAISCKFGKPRQACLNSTVCRDGRALEHDPEKWIPVFGKDHAQTKNLDPDPIQLNWIMLYARGPTSANIAPCGSSACAIQEPPGTCMGPLMICPPPAFTRSTAASMLSMLK
jgi:hypothetical protein